jgi:hypothetical protein
LTEKRIHIVCFDVPFPADYGGVIDVYYRVKALHDLGFNVSLHCFEYGRGKHQSLYELAEHVFYYPRKRSPFHLLNSRPFIVASRQSSKLLNRLLQDDAPILFEGLHSTWYLEHPEIAKRTTYVRAHNIEHDYYAALAKNSKFNRRKFFQRETKKLNQYEPILSKAKYILCIRESDVSHFKKYGKQVYVLPASMPENDHKKYMKTDPYALFHGNLSISENEEAVRWLINQVWSKDENLMPLKVAGKNPSNDLIDFLVLHGVELIPNPKDARLKKLLRHARVHTLLSHQSTGVKLKLLAALQTSGHVLVNPTIVKETLLEECCDVARNSTSFVTKLRKMATTLLSEEEFQKRQEFLEKNFSTIENCKLFIDLK